MNRRYFLATASSSAAALAIASVPSKAFAAGPSSNPVYGTSNGVSTLTTGNMITQQTSSTDWTSYRNTLTAIQTDWVNGGYDAQLAPHYTALTTSNLNSSNLNQSQILQQVQSTHPSVTLTQLQHAWGVMDNMTSQNVQSFINTIQGVGFNSYLQGAIAQSNKYIQLGASENRERVLAQLREESRDNPLVSLPPPAQPGGGGGGCADSGFAADAVGLAFMTIGIMSGVGAIGEGLAWAAIAAWGGGGATVWGTANRWLC